MLRRLILAALFACGAAHAELPEPVAALLQKAHIPQDAIGLVVLRGDAPLVSHNAQQSMQPASTMKLFTTLVALEQLGPVFRGRTELRSSAPVVNGVLQGDLYLRGGADADFNEDALFHMLQALRSQGIQHIAGDVVLDRLLFQPARLDVGVAPFDEYPWAYYNVIPDALLLNTNLLKLELRASASGLSVAMLPEMDKVSVQADLKLTDAPCAKWEEGWKTPDTTRDGEQIKVVLHGSFPKNCVRSTSVNVLDRHDYLARLLRAQWSRLGGSLAGTVREAVPAASDLAPAAASQASAAGAPAPSGAAPALAGQPDPAARDMAPGAARLLAEHVSRALPEVLRDTNKLSDNTLARTIFLSLGSLEADPVLGSRPIVADPAMSTTARADLALRAWLLRHQIDDRGLVLDNGSGLSRSERATAAQLAGVLQAGQQSAWMPEFLSSLPIAALDGTMKRRLKDSPAAARARLKTGSLNGVIAIAGYVPDDGGHPCIVVAIINHPNTANGAGRTVLDGIVDWVAQGAR
ncbi:D-alanyl-D-alanine carboxypeptidase/D-alanyl-D-alanine-endopeptidase [Oxalobacteraceae bacterium A2-2]